MRKYSRLMVCLVVWAGFELGSRGPADAAAPRAAALPGQIIVDPATPMWLVYNRDSDGDGKLDPFFMCGPGDPEGFLYRGSRNSDGTRNGDQMQLINKMKGTGANCIYFQAVRSHGGDGPADHNPFISSNPSNGLDQDILNQWETWFTEMDNNRIVIYFFFYDDSARIWNTGDSVGSAERSFLQGLVNKFEHHKHLIWCVAEEYQERFSAARVSNIAKEIRAADDNDHVIAVHKLGGLTFSEFANDPNIEQFAIQQWSGNANAFHNDVVKAWNNAAGKYNLNQSEGGPLGRGATARKNFWAMAMGGAYVMVLYDELDGIKETPLGELQDQGRVVRFFESTNFNVMSPNDGLAHGGTKWVLALPGDSYIAYSPALSGNIGLKSMTAGTYDFKWYDVTDGTTVNQTGVSVASGNQTWGKPGGIGNELAVHIRRTSCSSSNTPPSASDQNVIVPHNTPTGITLNYTDPDGPGGYTFTIVSSPSNGTLTGSVQTRTYTPNNGTSGPDSFTWRVNDGMDDSNTATVSITVQSAGNNAPVANNQSFTTAPDTPVIMSLSYSDPDGPGPYGVTIVTQPGNGTLSGTGNDRTYTPTQGYVGTDSFTWRVNDGQLDSNTATVTITVTSGLIITSTSPASYVWDVLDVGKLQYIDRTYTFDAVPSSYVGLDFLRTANDDKGSSGSSFITFDVSQDVTVYVAHDDRFSVKPPWMAGTGDTGDDLGSGGPFSLWTRDFPAGTVTLGGNTDDGVARNSMYSVVVRARSGGPSGDADADGLPDNWEISYFGDLGQSGSDDPDGDLLTNQQEYSMGTDPNNPDQDNNGVLDGNDDWDGDGTPNRNDATPGGPPGPAPTGGGGSGGDGCGATGLEALFLLFLLKQMRISRR